MAWLRGKVSLGNFPDLSEAVNKLSESVKNIEKNFDTALGLEEKEGEGSGLTDKNAKFDPTLGYVGQSTAESSEVSSSTKTVSTEKQSDRDGESAVGSSEKLDSSKPMGDSGKQGESDNLVSQASEQIPQGEEVNEEVKHVEMEGESGEKIKNLGEEPNNDATADLSQAEVVDGGPEDKKEDTREKPKDDATMERSEAEVVDGGPEEKKEDTSEKPKDDATIESSEAEVVDGGPEEKKEDTSEKPKDDVTVERSEAEVTDRGFAEERKDASGEPKDGATADHAEAEVVSPSIPAEASEQKLEKDEQRESVEKETSEQTFPSLELVPSESVKNLEGQERSEEVFPTLAEPVQTESTSPVHKIEDVTPASTIDDDATSYVDGADGKNAETKGMNQVLPAQAQDASKEPDESTEESASDIPGGLSDSDTMDKSPALQNSEAEALKAASDLVTSLNNVVVKHLEKDANVNTMHSSTRGNSLDVVDSMAELEKVKKEMKMMETALHGAARQAQAKADEIARLMNENEKLEVVIKDLRRKTNEETESLREEYHQRVSTLERKMYALTRERDTLRREHNKKSDAAALLKEKDEIITQVMAEGEELSKKQAAQESQIRKLRAQVREFEEEKKGLLSKIQVEENKVESIKRDKAATEKLLQETIDKHQVELAGQKEYYTKALDAAKEAEAVAQARANSEARTELERRLRETEDRESMLVQTLEELRQTLSRKEQQAVFREDMLRRDIEDLQKRYQASERRCEELITQVPESTRPLMRQIESMQETASRRAEAWAAVERNLNSRLQEAEARATASEEKERSTSERLTQTLSRMNVLEAQISCLRAEQTQLTRSLEKERQRAAENRQEYLALKEVADTHESRSQQLEEEIREIRAKHKQELHEIRAHQEFLQQELEKEKAARFDQERSPHLHSISIPDPSPREKPKSNPYENGNLPRRISSASSLNSVEESSLLLSTLGSPGSLSEIRNFGEGLLSPYYMRSVTLNTYEATLRQKEGELASYASRLASMESIRDSLAEELVKLTAQCEHLRSEAAALPGTRAELDALRRRHSAALELMGERDEELEELRADIVDLKDMYREQVNLLVDKIQRLSSSIV